MNENKFILDPCCGGKMFWFDCHQKNTVFMDKRTAEKGHIALYPGRNHEVQPDIIADFRDIPFDSGTFKLVVFDPPHLIINPSSYMAKKYGTLKDTDWASDLRAGFQECWRVLEEYGILIFKWNETSITVKRILEVVGHDPLFGHKSGKASKTHWMCFMKIPKECNKK